MKKSNFTINKKSEDFLTYYDTITANQMRFVVGGGSKTNNFNTSSKDEKEDDKKDDDDGDGAESMGPVPIFIVF
jgi:hypothetical protein